MHMGIHEKSCERQSLTGGAATVRGEIFRMRGLIDGLFSALTCRVPGYVEPCITPHCLPTS